MADTEKIKELEKRVYGLEQEAHELKKLIIELKRDSGMMGQVIEKPSPVSERPRENPVFTPKKKQRDHSQVDWEKRIGQVWLPRIFIFVLLLGIIWAFKAASDYGLIHPPVKVAIGYLTAGLLLFGGYHQLKKGRSALGQVLLSGSVILLLIDTFAMHVLYGMVPVTVAFILNIVWIALGIYLANHYQSQPLAILTGVGGYLIPFLLESEQPNTLFFVGFETIFYLVLLLFAMRKSLIYLYFVAFGLLHVTLLAGVIFVGQGDERIFGIAILMQHVLLLAAFLMRNIRMKQQLFVLFTSFMLTMGWANFTFTDLSFKVMSLLAFALYGGLAYFMWNKEEERRDAALSIATIAPLFFLAKQYEVDELAWLIMIQGLIGIFLGNKTASRLQQGTGTLVFAIGGLSTLSQPFYEIFEMEFVNWVALTASSIVIYRLVPSAMRKDSDVEQVKKVILGGSLLLLLAFITLTSNALTWMMTLNIQTMAVSIAWAIYALAGMIIGVMRENKVLRVFGLILLFVTLAKLIFVDLSYVSIVIRAFLFIVLGVIGIAGSRIFYKSK